VRSVSDKLQSSICFWCRWLLVKKISSGWDCRWTLSN